MTDNAASGLLPCPFCGSSSVKMVGDPADDDNRWCQVFCDACGCRGNEYPSNPDAAARAWNRRAGGAPREPVAYRYRWAKPLVEDDKRWRYCDGPNATLVEENDDFIVEHLYRASPARQGGETDGEQA